MITQKSQFWYQAAIGFFSAIIFLVPLFFWPNLSQAFDLPKTLLFRLLLSISTGLFCIHLFQSPSIKKIHHPIITIFTLLSLILTLAGIFSPGPLQSFFGTYERVQGLIQWGFLMLFFFLGIGIIDNKNRQFFLQLLLANSLIIALYSLSQKLGFDPLFGAFDTRFFLGRTFAMLGNPDFLGQYLGMIIPISAAFLLNRKSRRYFQITITILIFLLAIYFSKSRAPIAGLIFAGTFGILYFARIKWQKSRLDFVKFLKILSLILATTILIISILLNKTAILDRFKPTPENTISIISRFSLWESSTEIIKKNPLLGIGPENFQSQFPSYVKPNFYEVELDMNTVADRTHNDILQFGVDAGMPALILWLLLIIYIIQSYFKLPPEDIIQHGAHLSVITYFGQNLFSFSQVSHLIVFFFLLAIIIKGSGQITKKSTKIPKPLIQIFSLITIIALPFIYYYMIHQPFKAENYYTKSFYEDDNRQSLEQAIKNNPYFTNFRYSLLMSYPETTSEQVVALKKIEGETMDTLGWEAVDLSKTSLEKAIPVFKKAIALNFDYPHIHSAFADTYFRHKKFSEAIKEYEIFLNLSPKFWQWCPEIQQKTAWEKWQYRIFHKNTNDFQGTLIHLKEAYEKMGNQEKTTYYKKHIKCLYTTDFGNKI